jgi:hypothetical protein
MSIQDESGNEFVRLPGFWTLLAKLAIGLSIPMAMAVITLGTWVIVSIFNHSERITVLEYATRQTRNGGSQTTSVNVGSADSMAAQAGNEGVHRDYLVVDEVASKLGVEPRTVINYIAAQRFEPAPVKDGKEWHFSEKVRLLPNNSEPFRIAKTEHEEP